MGYAFEFDPLNSGIAPIYPGTPVSPGANEDHDDVLSRSPPDLAPAQLLGAREPRRGIRRGEQGHLRLVGSD